MKVIGLTGGIGAGKSTVAALLAEHGAVVIDVDALGREVIGPGGAAVAAVVEQFGVAVRAPDGSIDRPALASKVFGDPDALGALNAISHPAIDALLDERLGELAKTTPDAVVILDMAVLTESTLGRNIKHAYQEVIVVETSSDIRIERLIGRGHTRKDAVARMASQATGAQRRAIADHIVTNNTDLEQLRHSVDALWRRLND